MSFDVRAEVGRFDASLPVEEAWMPPSSWYTAPEFGELERRAVFAGSWIPVARAAEVAELGSVRAGCVAGEPWLLVRGADGKLRGFHNVCRHKGTVLVADDATRADGDLVCGYHGWRYALDGRLTSAPRVAGIRDFDRDAMSLAPLAVETWGPWVFVCSRPEAPLARSLAPLTARLDDTSWTELVYHSSQSWTLECNWKVYVDNYLDGGYHIEHMHPSLDAQLDMASYKTELFDGFSVQSSPGASDRIGSGALYAFIHPNFMVNRYGDCLDSNLVIPLGPDRCRVDYDFFFAASVTDEVIEASIEASAITQREDIAVSESVQVGLRSSSYDRGRYAPRIELAEHHFHCALHGQLLAAVQDI